MRKAVSSTVIVDKNGKVLILKRSDRDDCWNFPGGAVESGESVMEAASREVMEESNLFVDKKFFTYIYTKRTKTLRIDFFITKEFLGVVTINHESSDFKWVDISELMSYTFPGGKLESEFFDTIKLNAEWVLNE